MDCGIYIGLASLALTKQKRLYSIMDFVIEEISSLCRICLEVRAVIPIFDNEDTLLKLNLCLGEIPDLPEYPRNMCETCYGVLNEAVTFINKFRDSCKLLEKKIKEEPNDLINEYSEPEIEVDFISSDIVKAEFENFQYETPEFAVENNTTIEAKETSTSEINNFHVRKQLKKYEGNRIAGSLLEGEFVFQGENWSFKNTNKLVKKSNEKTTIKSNKIKPKVKQPKGKSGKKTKIKKQLSSQTAPILCEECGKSFTNVYKYSRHKSSHLSEKPYKCTKCLKQFSFSANLNHHIKRIHSKEKHICSDCGKVFFGRELFISHYKFVHQRVKRKYKGHPCKLCGKVLITVKTALIHQRSAHTGERPAICTVCDARFFHEDYLKEHMRLHTGETPFKCPVCDKGFAQRGNMKSHMKHNHSISQLSEQIRNKIDKKYFKHMKP